MHNRPMIFHTTGDCGCGSAPVRRYDGRIAADPTVICDDRYLTIAQAARLKVLGIIPGANCQARFTTLRGFLMDDGTGNGQFISTQPELTLPSAAAGKYLMLGSSATNSAWSFLAAPSSGNHRVEVQAGEFKLVDASTIPGLSVIAADSTLKASVQLFGLWTDGSIKKLNTPDGRLLVGVEDGDGNRAVEALETGNPLTHPIAEFPELRVRRFVALDADEGGFPIRDNVGSALTNGVLMIYDAVTGFIYRAPTGIAETGSSSVDTNSGTSYAQPAPHLLPGTFNVNYPTLHVSFNLVTKTTERHFVALYMDGVQKFEWDFSTTDLSESLTRCVAGSFILKDIPLGSHSFEFRVKTITTSIIKFSSWSMFSIK